MPSLDFILPHVLPMMLVITRLSGLFVFTPMLTSANVPRQYRVLLCVMYGLAVYPFVPAFDSSVAIDSVELIPLLFSELMIGLVIGLIASIPLLAVQMGGYIMGYQIGLSLAESFNPVLESNGSVVGDLLFYLAVFAFIGIGGLDILFANIAESFHTVPVGTFMISDVPLDMFLGVLSSGFEIAIRVSTPVMAIVSMLMVSMGFIMKTMPQINIMSVGFAAQIVCGLTMLLAGITVVGNVAGESVQDTLDLISVWIQSFGDAPTSLPTLLTSPILLIGGAHGG